MQTFLPYASIERSVRCLDNKRLGKQRVECQQILTVLRQRRQAAIANRLPVVTGYRNHPAVLMWEGHEAFLEKYYNAVVKEWCRRGFRNTMKLVKERVSKEPSWFGDDAFHRSHRSNLLRKDPVWYGQYGWTDPADLPYIWPVRSSS